MIKLKAKNIIFKERPDGLVLISFDLHYDTTEGLPFLEDPNHSDQKRTISIQKNASYSPTQHMPGTTESYEQFIKDYIESITSKENQARSTSPETKEISDLNFDFSNREIRPDAKGAGPTPEKQLSKEELSIIEYLATKLSINPQTAVNDVTTILRQK